MPDVSDETEEVCGETYDHDLREVDRRDGWVTWECHGCGAEILEEEEMEM